MTEIKLIALDMDGTLLTNEHKVAKETVEAINYARDKGVKVMLATGRALSLTLPYAKELNLDTYLAVSNGAELWDMEGNLLKQESIATHQFKQLWEIGEDLQVDMWAIASENVYYAENPPQSFDKDIWLKIGYGQLDEHLKERILHELHYFKDDLEITNSYVTNIEVNKFGVNKLDAISFVCERENITLDQVLVAGDGLNDQKMIEAAGIGVAMGNAQEVLKQVADDVTDTNENHGVAKMIYKYIK